MASRRMCANLSVPWPFVPVLAMLVLIQWAHAQPRLRTDGLCIVGGRHKVRASPETGFKQCHPYQNNSCCSADFTEVLARATVTSVDNFHWGRCGPLSEACEDFMIHIECFYRCSPNAANWEGAFPSSIAGVPICSHFCDDWWAACRNELSCATNWLFDYNTTDNGTNYCRTDSQCLTWTQRYGNATNMCNTLWGRSFVYTRDSNCIDLNGTDIVERNAAVSQRILNASTATTTPPTPSRASSCHGSMAAHLAMCILCYCSLMLLKVFA